MFYSVLLEVVNCDPSLSVELLPLTSFNPELLRLRLVVVSKLDTRFTLP